MLDQEGEQVRRQYRVPGHVRVLESHVRVLESHQALDASEYLTRAPRQLYVAGDAGLLRAPLRVSIVGARETSGGRRSWTQLAERGVVVASGLADGVDGAAHRAVLSAGGRTIAVIGTPLDCCYPAKHAALQEVIYRDHLALIRWREARHDSQAPRLSRGAANAMSGSRGFAGRELDGAQGAEARAPQPCRRTSVTVQVQFERQS